MLVRSSGGEKKAQLGTSPQTSPYRPSQAHNPIGPVRHIGGQDRWLLDQNMNMLPSPHPFISNPMSLESPALKIQGPSRTIMNTHALRSTGLGSLPPLYPSTPYPAPPLITPLATLPGPPPPPHMIMALQVATQLSTTWPCMPVMLRSWSCKPR